MTPERSHEHWITSLDIDTFNGLDKHFENANFVVQITDTATLVLKPILVSIAFFVGSGNESNVSALSCKLINPAEN